MQSAYVVTGSLANGQHLTLDETLPIQTGKVRVIVEVLPSEPTLEHAQFMADLRERQRQRGHVPRSRQEIDAGLQAERDSWDD